MKYLAIWAYTDQDNDVQCFVRLYNEQPTTVVVDAYREANDLRNNASVTAEDLDWWEAGLCQVGEIKVYKLRIAARNCDDPYMTEHRIVVQAQDKDGKWQLVHSFRPGNPAIQD